MFIGVDGGRRLRLDYVVSMSVSTLLVSLVSGVLAGILRKFAGATGRFLLSKHKGQRRTLSRWSIGGSGECGSLGGWVGSCSLVSAG